MKRKTRIVFAICAAAALTSGIFAAGSLFAPGTLSAETKVGDVPFVPTPQPVVDEMLRLARPSDADILFDLGSGDGRIVTTAAKRFGTRGTGVDIDADRVKDGRRNAEREGVSRLVSFVQRDLFEVDLRPATVVTLYLLPTVNLRLRPKLLRELRPGARVVSHAFDMGDWKPDETSSVSGAAVYLWVVPADAAGLWRWRWQEHGPATGKARKAGKEAAGGTGSCSLQVHQRFQNLQAELECGGRRLRITRVRLAGDRLHLDARGPGGDELRFSGRVGDEKIDGHLEQGEGRAAQRASWRAWRERPAVVLRR